MLAALDSKTDKLDILERMWVSKLLGQLFPARLAVEVPPSFALVNGASPGAVHDSEFNRELDKTLVGKVVKVILKCMANSSAVAARMMTDAMVHHGEETHGRFLSIQKVVS